MEYEERAIEIRSVLDGLKNSWNTIEHIIDSKIKDLIVSLVNQNNEETRGKIKALQDLKQLPIELQSELEGIRAALSEQDAAS